MIGDNRDNYLHHHNLSTNSEEERDGTAAALAAASSYSQAITASNNNNNYHSSNNNISTSTIHTNNTPKRSNVASIRTSDSSNRSRTLLTNNTKSTTASMRKKSTRQSRKRSLNNTSSQALSSTNNNDAKHNPNTDPQRDSDTSFRSGGSGSGSGRRKEGGDKDKRWSKRFSWTDEIHRDFVAAVFDVGLKHSSPSAIMEQMPRHEHITSERVKSHLQKYRLHRQKSKEKFMGNYDATMLQMKAGEYDTADSRLLNFGEVAAHLSCRTMSDVEVEGRVLDTDNGVVQHEQILHLPQLSAEELLSPIGASMGYLMGLFHSLKKQLVIQRHLTNGHAAEMMIERGGVTGMCFILTSFNVMDWTKLTQCFICLF